MKKLYPVLLLIFYVPFTTLMGAFWGWTTELCFGSYILDALSAFGVHGVTMTQLGASLGFVTAFTTRRPR